MRGALMAVAIAGFLTPAVAQAGAINLMISDSLDGLIADQNTVSGTNSFSGSSAHFDTISVMLDTFCRR